MLDFRVESFLTVCQTMNFTQAAALLHITQPAVSHQIRVLEEAYGAALLISKGKKLQLTEAGKLLREAALTMQHDADLLKAKIDGLHSGQQSLTFGASLTVGEFTMPPLLARYLSEHPDARVTMQVADTQQLLQSLDHGEIDFAIVEGAFPGDSYDSLLFRTERFIPVCGRDYVFQRPVERVQDLLGERLLVREKGSGTRHILQTYLESQNLSVENFARQTQIGNIAALKALAEMGCGITFLYEAAVAKELVFGTLKEIKLHDFHIQHDFSFIWRKNSLFADHYREVFQLLHEEDGDDSQP